MTANVSTVNLSDGRVVTLSYGVAVAVFVPADVAMARQIEEGPPEGPPEGYRVPYGYLKTDRTYSATSSRHANLYARQNGSVTRTVPHAVFRELVAPIETEE